MYDISYNTLSNYMRHVAWALHKISMDNSFANIEISNECERKLQGRVILWILNICGICSWSSGENLETEERWKAGVTLLRSSFTHFFAVLTCTDICDTVTILNIIHAGCDHDRTLYKCCISYRLTLFSKRLFKVLMPEQIRASELGSTLIWKSQQCSS